MSPHAVPVMDSSDTNSYDGPTWTRADEVETSAPANGVRKQNWLQRFGDDEVHDLVCVGFGPASLAIAVALHDAIEDGQPRLRTYSPKVRFLEKQQQFRWHAGMLLPGAKMQITFIKDLATFRNPRSHFTFLNYLHENGRLVQFANLGTFLPHRIEYEGYMGWAASHFDEVVDYSQSVQSVTVAEKNPQSGAIESFMVHSLDQMMGHTTTIKAKNVVIAAGGKPSIPKSLPANHPRIIHSSQYATTVHQLFPPGTQPRSVAVIGAGQSAAEVFNNIPSRFPAAKSYLCIRGGALRPSDDSPFVNEIFDPERVDDVFSQKPELRKEQLARDKSTNYAVVRLELLEHIYEMLYSYRVQYGNDETQWPQRILTHRSITGVSDSEVDGHPSVQLHLQNNSGDYCARKQSGVETLDVDLIVVASGYQRDSHEDMLQDLRHLMPEGDAPEKRWTVRRDYGVEFAEGAVSPDAGLWLQGCNEQTHGLADSLLSILANRSGEMVENLFGSKNGGKNGVAL
ncbi:hydroxylase [Hortaea werneckii]|uniref:L-ornithine N(5)-monooxygenase [NAD(P)H] n=1 Tax=Hortaea werneckii TaxID=91943 RepID=A0A3M7BDS5_HORWE|nr:hydroxylase [Hortaea werneckii]RMY37834.1 hypothetical protein D0865_13256 [Hortaea werneckii]